MPQPPAPAGERRVAPRVSYLPPATCRIIALEPHSCRWPIGETGAESFVFCAAPRFARGSYCAHHAACSCERLR